jgi:hypothetical protein
VTCCRGLLERAPPAKAAERADERNSSLTPIAPIDHAGT